VLRVNIAEIEPPIWRMLNVPGECTLGDLHIILQIAFGWEDGHMHSFTIKSTQYGRIDVMGFDDDDVADEDAVRLCDLPLRSRQKFTYLYDFGDSWEHEITVSKTTRAGGDEYLPRVRCLEGERAGPPEDSGGAWGYMDALEILKDPTDEQYEETREWLGKFDPEDFNLKKINTRLERIFKSRPKKT
ncbi:MAG: plasmid pRiA4b ORF-3 family protein, partial [Treponema sp.]|jgi:hypothetical protein|nr:plasmid pRiA4b ORF-3 family protein [Treponema sp.]